MKEHDLGKDCLAAGPAYRAVPSREVLPANEVDHYQLANVQVSPKCSPSYVSMFTSGPDCILSASVSFRDVGWCWRSHALFVLKNIQLLFLCLDTVSPIVVRFHQSAICQHVRRGSSVALFLFVLHCRAYLSLPLSLSLSPPFSIPPGLPAYPAAFWLAAFFLLRSVVYITRARPFWRRLPMALQSSSDA